MLLRQPCTLMEEEEEEILLKLFTGSSVKLSCKKI
jgi:hypothetical protein